MKAFGLLLRLYSYLFHLIVSLFALGLGIVSAATHTPLQLDPIGISPEKALTGILVLGIVGLLSTVLSFTGIFRPLLPIWAAVVLYLMVKGFFLSPITFEGPDSFRTAALITLGAVIALVGALWALKSKSR